MRHQYSGGEGDTRFRPTCIYASLKHAARKLHFTRLPIVFFFWKRLVRNERERVWNIVAEFRGKFLSINLYEFVHFEYINYIFISLEELSLIIIITIK